MKSSGGVMECSSQSGDSGIKPPQFIDSPTWNWAAPATAKEPSWDGSRFSRGEFSQVFHTRLSQPTKCADFSTVHLPNIQALASSLSSFQAQAQIPEGSRPYGRNRPNADPRDPLMNVHIATA